MKFFGTWFWIFLVFGTLSFIVWRNDFSPYPFQNIFNDSSQSEKIFRSFSEAMKNDDSSRLGVMIITNKEFYSFNALNNPDGNISMFGGFYDNRQQKIIRGFVPGKIHQCLAEK